MLGCFGVVDEFDADIERRGFTAGEEYDIGLEDLFAVFLKRVIVFFRHQTREIVVGFDGAPIGKRAVLDGREHSSPAQYPKQMAKQTIEMIVKHHKGEEVPKEILIPTTLYTQEVAKKDDNVDGW